MVSTRSESSEFQSAGGFCNRIPRPHFMECEVIDMPYADNWADRLKAFFETLVDQLHQFFGADDDYEYIGDGTPNGKLNIEIHLTIRASKK